MTQKERLVELLARYDKWQIGTAAEVNAEYEKTADFLLSNGVIVPPFKVGEDVFVIENDNKIRKTTVLEISVDSDCIWVSVPDKNKEDYWTGHEDGSCIYKTREQAEQALKERETSSKLD